MFRVTLGKIVPYVEKVGTLSLHASLLSKGPPFCCLFSRVPLLVSVLLYLPACSLKAWSCKEPQRSCVILTARKLRPGEVIQISWGQRASKGRVGTELLTFMPELFLPHQAGKGAGEALESTEQFTIARLSFQFFLSCFTKCVFLIFFSFPSSLIFLHGRLNWHLAQRTDELFSTK